MQNKNKSESNQTNNSSSDPNLAEESARHTTDGFWEWDIANDVHFVSPKWLQMLGLSKDRAKELPDLWVSLLHPEDKDKAVQTLEDSIQGDQIDYHQQFRMRHKDGSYRWIKTKGIISRNEKGLATRITGIHSDYTEELKNTTALLEKQQKYENLFQNDLIGIFRSDLQTGAILQANEKFWQLAGVPPGKRENRKTVEFYNDLKDRDELVEIVKKNGKAQDIELQILKEDQTTVWVNYSVALYPKEGILESVIIDISKSKVAQQKLKDAHQKLDSFVYHASHDLKSPLRSMAGLINLYKAEQERGMKAEYINKIEENIEKLDHLVCQLLDLSKTEKLEEADSDINFMVEFNHAVSTNFSPDKDKGVEIDVRVSHLCQFISNLTHVKTILNNLISNALKYADHTKENPNLSLSFTCSAEKATFEVADNGVGIPKDNLSSIFDMFYRASELNEGSGLGLYIVKTAVEALDGKIEVHSTLGEGTRFTIEIPNKI